jgi:hypothetical protein
VLSVNNITNIISGTASLTFGSIGANTSAEQPISVTGAQVGDVCSVSPAGAVNAGFSWCAYCSSANIIVVRITNSTGAAGAPYTGALSWSVTAMRV